MADTTNTKSNTINTTMTSTTNTSITTYTTTATTKIGTTVMERQGKKTAIVVNKAASPSEQILNQEIISTFCQEIHKGEGCSHSWH